MQSRIALLTLSILSALSLHADNHNASYIKAKDIITLDGWQKYTHPTNVLDRLSQRTSYSTARSSRWGVEYLL